MIKTRKILLLIALVSIIFGACKEKKNIKVSKPESKRGIVIYPSDLKSLGARKWVKLMNDADLNLLGIHTDSKFETLYVLKEYLESEEGKTLVSECEKSGIAIEYETHALQDLLPRDLFEKHPEYFRMDETGKRTSKHNICFSSEGAYNVIEKNILEVAKWLKPTTHRYYFWTDDYANAFCHCEKCKEYTASEQALIYENRLLKMLRKADKKATVAHLAYSNTLSAPQKVKPEAGIFLEYAPISRNYDSPLTKDHMKHLGDNLKVFPSETSHILEYWLDESMFCSWNRSKLVRLPWKIENCIRDVKYYNSLGSKSITTFAAWIDAEYIKKFGEEHTVSVMNEYGKALKENIR